MRLQGAPRWRGWAVTGGVHVAMLFALASAFAPARPPLPSPLTISARLLPSSPTSPSARVALPPPITLPRSALALPPMPEIPPPPVQIVATPPVAVAATPLRFDPPAAAPEPVTPPVRTAPVAVATAMPTAAAVPTTSTAMPPTATESPASLPADHRLCSERQIARHYPAMLRERGIQGQVVLRVKVDADGHAAEVVVSGGSGWRLLDEAARRVAESCPYLPARRGDQRLVSWVEYPVRFALQSPTLQ